MLVLVLAMASATAATDPRLLEVAMPDAKVVFGMNFSRLRTSPMGDIFRTAMQAGMQQAQGGAELQNIFAQIGFNPFEDILELLVATTGTGKNPPTIVAMRGSPRLRALIESEGMRSKTGSSGLAVFGDVFIMGDEAQVKAVKARHGHGGGLSGMMTKRIAEMSTKFDLWFISNVPLASLANNVDDSKAQGLGNMEALKSIEQLSAGLGMSGDMVLQIEAVAHDAKSAGALGDTVQMLLAMAQQSAAAKDPAAVDALKRLEFGVTGKVLRIGIKVPEEQMRKQLETFRAQAAAGLIPGAPPAAAPARSTTPPRVPPTADIVIQSSPKDMGVVVISGSKK